MRKFKSIRQALRFVTADAAAQIIFNLGRHIIRAQRYGDFRVSAFTAWRRAVT